MDEQRLGELFRNAVGEVPPASFGPDEVVAASRRVAVKRRTALVGGTLLGVVVLVGGLAAGDVVDVNRLLPGQTSGGTSTAGQAAPEAGIGAPAPGTPHTLSVPDGNASPTPRSIPSAGAPVSCGPVDDELVGKGTAVLAERGVGVVGPAGEVPQWCAAGSRSAALSVPGATLYVLLIPQVDGPRPRDASTLDGERAAAVLLSGGRELVVILMPAVPGQRTALSDDIPAVAEELASRF